MAILSIVLLLFLGLLLSNIVSHYLPVVPTALTQIAFGILIALASQNYTFQIDAQWFLLLFVAPILYNDGRRFPREALWNMRAPILGNAFVLVILTTVVCGYVINLLIPSIPIAAAFALAAILSPTDPVAVTGIAKRIRIPEQIMTLVKGESLINDASGLVAFHYAIVAVVTGYFSIKEAVLDFSYLLLVGALAGFALALLITFLRVSLRKSGIIDVTFHSLLQILTPFVIYIVTDQLLHASGVIAVVTAGIVQAVIKERTETMIAEEQLLSENIWSITSFVLNGFVFLLLGMSIPSSMIATISDPNIGNWLAFGYIIAIGLVVLGIRFIWTLLVPLFKHRFLKVENAERLELKSALITTLTGVRGAVTLAGVLTVPAVLEGGAAFPERSLLIFLAAGVVLFLLLMATIFLPMLSKREPEAQSTENNDLSKAKSKLLLSAIQQIKEQMDEDNKNAALDLINEYTFGFQRNLSEQNPEGKGNSPFYQHTNEVRVLALNLQRRYLSTLQENGSADKMAVDAIVKLIDYHEETIEHSFHFEVAHFFRRTLHDVRRVRRQSLKPEKMSRAMLQQARDTQMKSIQAAITGLQECAKTHEHPESVYAVILDYERMLSRFSRIRERNTERYDEQKEELRLKVMDAERAEIRSMYESGEINKEQEKELRRFTNNVESVLLYEYNE